ncbi:hypothetical protein MicroSTF_14055 [Microbacterium sp. STF-2]|uniref:hypothetical protein n=1 Tax=Microbacterium sp. STF-2 TaxID=3031132 RepID=UPI002AFE0DAC|nr:hypothetical protein [Microbacterium sp. STF-2]MEA1264162.1 hypothetical protein [Microbacterium sp. STF-2]
MPITPTDLGGDENTARRVLVQARDIAPCIDSFPEDSEEKKDAIAVLKGVLDELPAAGSRRTRAMSRNGSSITLADIKSAFDEDARSSLRALCAASRDAAPGAPLGSFPTDRPFARVWPEGDYS